MAGKSTTETAEEIAQAVRDIIQIELEKGLTPSVELMRERIESNTERVL